MVKIKKLLLNACDLDRRVDLTMALLHAHAFFRFIAKDNYLFSLFCSYHLALHLRAGDKRLPNFHCIFFRNKKNRIKNNVCRWFTFNLFYFNFCAGSNLVLLASGLDYGKIHTLQSSKGRAKSQ